MIDWMSLTDEDVSAINRITKKAIQMMPIMSFRFMELEMDLQAAHLGCRLDLDQLENGDNGDFAHDVVGISKNIDRETGQLQNCFLPRCAAKKYMFSGKFGPKVFAPQKP